MIILGLNIMHEDTSAVLFRNSELLSAFEEERFNKIKHTISFPINSIKRCLTDNNLNIDDIDFIAVNYDKKYNFLEKFFFYFTNLNKINFFNNLLSIKKKISIKNIIEKELNLKVKAKIIFVPHHYAHHLSSFYFSGFKETLSLSIDGTGDFSTIEAYYFKNNTSKLILKKLFPNSLGFFYTSITQYLGFSEFGDEYKVMGLSSYGEPKYIEDFKKLITYNEKGDFIINFKYFNFSTSIFRINEKKYFFNPNIKDLLGPPRFRDDKIEKRHQDIAATLQYIFEDIVLKLLVHLNKKYKSSNLCLSGGCMQNSSLNGKIVENTTFKNFFIPPSSGDSGGAVGAVAAFLFKNNIMLAKSENNFYLGSQYSDNYIIDNVLKNLDKKSIQFKKMDFDELSKYVASKISQGQLVAWFQGRMEFGPRALGNRSILCDPRNADARKLINLKIKKREEFRPFAPSVLLEHADEYFYMNNIKEIPLMNVLVKVRESVRNIIPAVVHVDNTSRVHTVSMNINKNFHQLISDFKKITGVPILLNTSFNILNPIIENPTDAYNAFIESNIDILVLNNFYLEKIK